MLLLILQQPRMTFGLNRRLLGKDLTGVGLKDLQILEQQINDRLSSVRERKVHSLALYFHAFSLSTKSLSY